MKVLVDTSVWFLALRRSKKSAHPCIRELAFLIQDHRVEMMGPIRQEILSGIRDVSQFRKLRRRLENFPDLPITTGDYITAAKYFNLCRSRGIQGSNTDFLICAVAARNKLSIYTTDKDFQQYARHIHIVLHQPADR